MDIDRLSEVELIDLNHRIVARLRVLRELAAHASMLEFRIGEKVSFHPEEGVTLRGVITRYNKRSVSILTEDGQRWTVAPQLLERARPNNAASESGGKVVALRRPNTPRT